MTSSGPRAAGRPIQLTCSLLTLLAFASGVLGGCSMIKQGGAPEPSFSVAGDLRQLQERFAQGDTIKAFYQNPSDGSRNDFITSRITMMNIRYIQFVRGITAERQLLDSAAQMLVLGLSLAGATVATAGTKTILAAIAAGVTGSKEIIDKNYYYEKTIPALVAQMNAERRAALVPLLEGANRPLAGYSFAQAVTDLHNYYFAGTFTGALQAIQVEAALKEQRADKEVRRILPATPEQIATKRSLTLAIGRLLASPNRDQALKSATRALQILKPDATPLKTLEEVGKQLQEHVADAKPDDVESIRTVFEDAGISVPVVPVRAAPAPVAPVPVTPVPVDPAPVTPVPVAPAPVTPTPVAPAPVTPVR